MIASSDCNSTASSFPAESVRLIRGMSHLPLSPTHARSALPSIGKYATQSRNKIGVLGFTAEIDIFREKKRTDIISYQLFWSMIQLISRNQRAVSPEAQPRVIQPSDCEI